MKRMTTILITTTTTMTLMTMTTATGMTMMTKSVGNPMFDHDLDKIKESQRSKHVRRLCGGSWETEVETDTATRKTDKSPKTGRETDRYADL